MPTPAATSGGTQVSSWTRLAATRRAGRLNALEGLIFVTVWRSSGPRLPRPPRRGRRERGARQSVEGNDGVYFVPALAGLGSPHWVLGARGLITGLTRRQRPGAPRPRGPRGGRLRDRPTCSTMEPASSSCKSRRRHGARRVPDGAPGRPRPDPGSRCPPSGKSTARVAALAGLGFGVWKTTAEIAALGRIEQRYEPELSGIRS